MPSIPLDPTHWTLVHPEANNSQVVTSKGGASFFSTSLVAPPEETSANTFSPSATEVAANGTTTVTIPKYFKAKKQSSTEELKPVVLELAQPVEIVTASQLGENSVTGKSTAADLTGLRLIHQQAFEIKEKTPLGITTAYLGLSASPTAAPAQATAGKIDWGTEPPSELLFTAANYEVVGKSTKAVLVVDIITGKAPESTFVFGVYAVSAIAEVSKKMELTAAVLAGSTATFTTPAGKSGLTKTSAAFALTNAVNYTLGFTNSAETAAESLVTGTVKVYVENV